MKRKRKNKKLAAAIALALSGGWALGGAMSTGGDTQAAFLARPRRRSW